MATPSPAPPASAAAAAATTSGASDPSSATHLLSRPFASPPLLPAPPFSSQPLSKPLGHPPPPPPPQGFLYHQRGFATTPAAGPAPAASDQSVAVANPAVYTRNATPAAAMTFAAATQSGPFACGPVDRPVRNVRPRLPPSTSQPVTPIVVPRPVVTAAGASRSAPVATQLKAAILSSVSSTPEHNNCKERDESREDDVVVIHDRKVRVLDGCSPSLYSLCRSWMRNGQPHEIKLNFANTEKPIPIPLPLSMFDAQVMKQHEDVTETEDVNNEEPVGCVEELSAHDLLEIHINHAKRVRARLQKNAFGGWNVANKDWPFSFCHPWSLKEMKLTTRFLCYSLVIRFKPPATFSLHLKPA